MQFGINLDVCTGYGMIDALGRLQFVDSVKWEHRYPLMQGFKYADGSDGWYLQKDFWVRIGTRIYHIKKGFDYDGASIPRAAWTLIGHPLRLDYLMQALWHDMAYSSHMVSNKEADDTFLALLACTGDNSWARRNAMWTAVRGVGWTVYPKAEAELCKYREFYDVYTRGSGGVLFSIKKAA